MGRSLYKKKNIVLIGMPGAGKSTVGVILAKAVGFSFCDTDLIIQKQEGQILQQIITDKGIDYFLEKEKEIICSLHLEEYVIATGGSVIYIDVSMHHLKKTGSIIYLEVTFRELLNRIKNMTTRGIAMHSGQTFRDIFKERVPLYAKYAERTIVCKKKKSEEIVEQIIKTI